MHRLKFVLQDEVAIQAEDYSLKYQAGTSLENQAGRSY